VPLRQVQVQVQVVQVQVVQVAFQPLLQQ